MDLDELTREDWIQIILYGTLALYLAISIPRLFRGRILAGFAALLFWSGLFVAILVGYSYRSELSVVVERVAAVVFPGTVVESAPGEVTVFRRTDGQFVVNATLKSTKLQFILDTGASTVVLRQEDAVRLRLPVRSLRYDVPVSTANGSTLTAAVDLPSLQVGSIVEHDVPALVARPGALQENLLGMSFLTRLDSFTFSGDRLMMRGRRQ